MTGISRKDIWDIYVMRSMLEGLCARWAAEHITDEQLDELEEAILLSEFQVKKSPDLIASQVAVLDGRFHAILYEASGSRILSHVLTDFHNYVKMARVSSVVSEDRARKSIREHRQILRAIRDRDRGYGRAAGKRTYHACNAEPEKAGLLTGRRLDPG